MIYVALLEGVALIVTALTFAHIVRWMIREHARERNLMLNQLMHLAGRTWQPPPGPPEPAYDDEEALAAELSLLDPGQLPYP